MYLNKYWCCLEFDLTGSDLGFTTRFWISMTELFLIMSFFTITGRNKNQWIYQWICDIQILWKLSYIILLKIIVFELFKNWTMLIVCLFCYIIIFIWLTVKPNNLKLYSRIPEKHDRSSIFGVGFLWNQSCSSVHLSVCPSVHSVFFKILCTRIFVLYTKTRQS